MDILPKISQKHAIMLILLQESEQNNKVDHRETWDVKSVPQLSFTKAMKEGWQMNGRWKEGGLIIELFRTTRASMKLDRMIPSGSSWLMGVKVQRVMDDAHSIIEPGKRISMSKFHQITGHTGEHLLRQTAKIYED